MSVFGLIIQCKSPKIYYEYPKNLSEETKQELDVRLERGKIIFKKYCSQCHGIYGKGVDSIPNFTKEKMDSYTSGFLRGDASNHAFVMQLTEEQLKDALIFGLLVRLKNSKDSARNNAGK